MGNTRPVIFRKDVLTKDMGLGGLGLDKGNR